MNRREFCWSVMATTVAGCYGTGDDDAPNGSGPGTGDRFALPQVPPQGAFQFGHGVASGDPLSDQVILWTRVTPDKSDLLWSAGDELVVDWVVATDRELMHVVSEGRAYTSAERDYTVKIDVTGLDPDTSYYYQFFDATRAQTSRSSLGRTRTLPVGDVDRIRFAVCSCSCYAVGYFNSYAHIAQRADIQAVLHLGDYIYEYGPEEYHDAKLDRAHEPAHEIVSLQDYRTRYAQYRTDSDLLEAHRQHPFITIWDDHEVTDNSHASGADNHNPELGEGDYRVRRAAAEQAYREWMPIREDPTEGDIRIQRSFRFGNLLDLVMLDTRLEGRDPQQRGAAENAERQLLGFEQETWLHNQLRASKARGTRWRVLGQLVMVAQLEGTIFNFNIDQWDGYATDRDRLFNLLEREHIDNVVVLTGDIHSSWANDLARDPWGGYDRRTGEGALAVEYVVTSVTSPGFPRYTRGAASSYVSRQFPHVRWHEFSKQGYLVLDVNHERVQGEWFLAETVKAINPEHECAAAYRVGAGRAHLEKADSPCEPLPAAVLA